jgi:hypothetical protein
MGDMKSSSKISRSKGFYTIYRGVKNGVRRMCNDSRSILLKIKGYKSSKEMKVIKENLIH